MDRRDQLPPRVIPVLYLAFARICLAVACAAVAAYPGQLAAFVYQPRLLAVVHLVTLGWITASILGALYIVCPVALRTPVPARQIDYWAFGLTAIGIIGMVAHFWIAQFGGMAWAALTVTAGIAIVVARIAAALRRATIQGFVLLHIWFAFANILIAAAFGSLLGFDKTAHVLPGDVLANVFAHAHLAAIGWATMMVVGISYRMIPMLLPAAMPPGTRPWLTAVLLEVGVLGLAVAIVERSRWDLLFASMLAAAIGLFLSTVGWMRRHRKTPPASLRLPDYGMMQVGAALVCLVCATAIGVWLAWARTSTLTLQAALAYGVLGLVGFLGQMIAGVEARLLPMFAWYWEFADTDFTGPAASPGTTPFRPAQRWGALAWIVAIPLLAIGFFADAAPLVRTGALLLLAGVGLGGLDAVIVLRHAFGFRQG